MVLQFLTAKDQVNQSDIISQWEREGGREFQNPDLRHYIWNPHFLRICSAIACAQFDKAVPFYIKERKLISYTV